MKNLKRYNESLSSLSYDDAVIKMGEHIALETWHDYMGGSMSPRCDDEGGIITTLSMIYSVDKKKVRSDIDTIVEECKSGKRKFK